MNNCMGSEQTLFSQRFIAFLIDFIVISFIILVVAIISAMLLIFVFTPISEAMFFYNMIELFYACIILGCIIFIMKDIVKGQSVGKRMMRLTVIDLDTRQTPKKLKLILRNITLLLWPLDFAVYLIKKKRLGDIIAKTIVMLSR